MAASIFYAGYLGTAAIGANELSVRDWSVDGVATLVEFENSKTGPIPVPQGTWQHYTITMMLDCDFANGIFSTPYSIALAATISNLNLYQHQSAKSALGTISTPPTATIPGWVFPSAVVERINNRTVIEGTGKVTYNLTLRGYGAFTTPT